MAIDDYYVDSVTDNFYFLPWHHGCYKNVSTIRIVILVCLSRPNSLSQNQFLKKIEGKEITYFAIHTFLFC